MRPSTRIVLKSLVVAVALTIFYIALFGLYPKYFDIQWDEEVLLHDGRVVWVHVKRTYERQGMRLVRYPESPRQVSMSISFLRNTIDKFEHTFVRGTLHFLDEKEGKWYIGYHSDPGDPSVEIGSKLLYPHVAILNADGSIVRPDSWDDVPAEMKSANILPATPNPNIVAKFNGARLTNDTKMAHWTAYPTGAGWGVIHRITPQPVPQRAK